MSVALDCYGEESGLRVEAQHMLVPGGYHSGVSGLKQLGVLGSQFQLPTGAPAQTQKFRTKPEAARGQAVR